MENKKYMSREEYLAESAELHANGGDPFLAHRKYYGQMVDEEIISYVTRRIPLSMLRESKDRNFNDLAQRRTSEDILAGVDRPYVPLSMWDSLAVPGSPLRKRVQHVFKATGYKGGVSLSDTVCLAKEACRIALEASDE